MLSTSKLYMHSWMPQLDIISLALKLLKFSDSNQALNCFVFCLIIIYL